MGVRVAGGGVGVGVVGSTQSLRVASNLVGDSRAHLKVSDVHVLKDSSRFSSCRACQSSAGSLSWNFHPPLRTLSTHGLDDDVRGNESLVVHRHEGRRRVQFRASQATEGIAHEIKVCTQKACRKSGSLQTLDVLRSLAPSDVAVDSCGCLGKCGLGPNLVVLPGQLIVSHCSTAAHAARLMDLQCGAADPATNLKALGLKEQGNKSFQVGDLERAEKFYSEAIELKPSGGLHFIYGNRSAARLATGDSEGALEDATQAAILAPLWSGSHLRKADAYVQRGDFVNAKKACSRALQLDPTLRRSKSLQAKLKQIEESLELERVNA
ncbi:hypothetical protein Mapa_005574 [Marchantia paleacea]|nr:hypothetical protein Mapa_005574 [Marchantia paleacea]